MNDAISAAVAWWRDVLKNAKQDISDSAGSYYRASFCAIKPLLTEGQLDAFAAELTSSLETIMRAAEPAVTPEVALHVEYSPQGLLYAAARKGKIGSMYFPVQTHMHVRSSQVDITKPGSGGIQTIWRIDTESKTT